MSTTQSVRLICTIFPWSLLFTCNMHWIPCSLIKELKKKSLICVWKWLCNIKELMNSPYKPLFILITCQRGALHILTAFPHLMNLVKLNQLWKYTDVHSWLYLLVSIFDNVLGTVNTALRNQVSISTKDENWKVLQHPTSLSLLWHRTADGSRNTAKSQHWSLSAHIIRM